MSILRLLGLEKRGGSPRKEGAKSETETVRKIVGELEAIDPAQAKFLACFAFILSRVANADMEISPEETREMERIVRQWGDLSEDKAVLVVHIAKTQSRLFGGTENYLVTREFSAIASREQKTRLLHCLFAVSAADDTVSSHEDAEIRKIASELKLTHAELIEIRSAYRGKLSVLKGLR